MVSTTPTSQVDPGYVIGFCWSKDLGPKSASKSEPRVCHGYRMDIEVASKSGPRACVRAKDSTEGMPGKLELGYAGAYDGAKENEPRVDLLG